MNRKSTKDKVHDKKGRLSQTKRKLEAEDTTYLDAVQEAGIDRHKALERKRIIDNVQYKKKRLSQAKRKLEAVATADLDAVQEAAINRYRAVKAIMSGIRSPAWKEYMEQFAETPEQLERLMGTDETRDDYNMDLRRAYLVANAVCSIITPNDMDRGVNTIDDGLDGGS